MSIRTHFLSGGAICVIAATLAAPADAQVAYTRGHNKSVTERANEVHKPLGAHAGGFLALPALELGVEFNDNIYAASSNETSDTIFIVHPSVELQSQWSVHRLNLYADVGSRLYTDNDDDNTTDWRLGADGQLDVNRDMAITGRLFTGESTVARWSGSGPATLVEPIQYTYTEAGVAFVRNVNRIRASLGYNWSTFDFDNGRFPGGAIFLQDDRDRDEWEIVGRLDYAVTPDTAIFGSVTRRERDYNLDTPIDRDAQGWRYLVGANFDLTATVRGELGVGYSTTSYDSPALKDTDGFSASGRIDWFPTQLTTISLDGLRDTIDSDIAGASAIDRTGFGARIDHELRRDVVLGAGIHYDQDDYQAIDRNDDQTEFEAGARWYMNRVVTADATYRHYKQDSSGVNRDRNFDDNQIRFGITLRR